MLAVSNLNVSYGKHQALCDLSLQVDKGEMVVILGANGAGKSSLLRAVAGLCEGEMAGSVTLGGEDIARNSPDEIVSRGIALVPEGRAIFGDLLVEENLKLGAYTPRAQQRMQENLSLVYQLFPKLRERQRQVARTMSGGEQQMVAIGRALMSAPDFLLLDEPSLGLSPLLSKDLFQVLVRIRDAGIGVLVVEQNAKLSLSVADRGYLIELGSIVGEDSAQNLANDPAVQAAYLGATGKSATPAGKPHAQPSGAADTARGFVPPSGFDAKSADVPFSDTGALSDLVQRAGEIARQGPGVSIPEEPAKTAAPDSAPEAIAGEAKPPPVSAGDGIPPARPATVTDLKATEDRIESLLREFESAAANARNGGSASGTASTRRNGASRSHEPEEDLPVIPVYRKSEIEIYKRNQHGKLEPVAKPQPEGA